MALIEIDGLPIKNKVIFQFVMLNIRGYIYILYWVNYNDRTATSLESWLVMLHRQ